MPPGPREPAPVQRRPRRSSDSAALRWVGRLIALTVLLAALGVAGAGITLYGMYRHYSADLPDVHKLQAFQPRVMSRVYAENDQLLEELAAERRIWVPYAAIPDLVKRAFLAAEDQNFFSHGGVDPLAIARAAVTDMLQYGQGRRPVGASTITQQVAKNMLLGNQVTMARKVKEALLAIRIEHTLSKERILELYLNEIYLGDGAYGVVAAAQAYFDKSLDDLTPAEAAFLAALPKGPNNYNPQKNPQAARDRRDWVLDRMVDTRALSAAEAAAAKQQPLIPATPTRAETVAGADYFGEEVRRELIDRFGADQALQGGLQVRTSVEPGMQAQADSALRTGLLHYDQSHGGWRGPVAHLPTPPAALRADWQTALAGIPRPPGMLPNWQLGVVLQSGGGQAVLGVAGDPAGPRELPMALGDVAWARPVHNGYLGSSPRRVDDVLRVGDVVMVEFAQLGGGREHLLLRQIPSVQGALLCMDPSTGRVLAMAGGWSFEMSQFNRATQALRQPGSSFKPVVYLTAMEQGISPSQHFLDAPFEADDAQGHVWRPHNYELDYSGWVPLHVALEKSLNLVTVRVAQQLGMDAVANTAIGFHVVDSMPKVLPAALGAVDTTVIRLAGFYAALDEGGREVVPTLIDTVQDRSGTLIYQAPGLECQGCDNLATPPSLVDQRRQLADQDSVFQTVMMMEGVVQHGTGVPAAVGLNRQVAGKTGTTQDFNDAWFAGFTPDLVTVVWIGFDNPSSLGKDETGGAVAAPIWHDFMAQVLKGRPGLKFAPPPGVTVASYDSDWGTLTDAFKAGQVPGASNSTDTASADDNAGPRQPAGGSAGGVDSGLGGLY
jgi:penicillin-binding protein 1A